MCASDRVARVRVDHRTDVGRQAARIADAQLAHRALEHVEHPVGDVFLQAQDAQRRAALAGAVERGGERIGDHLLGQRGAVDDHRVLAAGLGDQHARSSVALAQRALDQPRDLGRAGEDHAGDARVADQRRADVSPLAGQELQHVGGHAGIVQQRARRRRRSAASARRAWRAPHCRRPVRR